MRDLPTGTITFLFTDIEGSTRLLQRLGDRYREVVDQHGRILREAIVQGGGGEVRTEGDSFFAVFPSSGGALAAAVHAQRALAAQSWPEGQSVRVRMGLHTGAGVLGEDDYIGLDVHLAARIAAAGHGGQILLSEATRAQVERTLPTGVSVRDLGRHRLKDIEHPEHLYDLVIDGLPAEFPTIRTLDARPTNLPPERTSFVGREPEVAEVTRLLGETRLLTLTGPGGTGKTRLALKVAAAHLDRFADGVFFADLSPIVDAALVPSVIAQALVVREEPGRDVLDSLADHLRDRHLLVVLDNSEQVIAAGAGIARLLDAAPRLTVLATSRAPFHLSAEWEYHVPPLALPDPAHLPEVDALTGYEAVALFTERASAVRPGFRVTEDNAQAVAEITARLDGLPLAIELGASRAKLLTPQDILARLKQRLPLLTGGARDVPKRQRTLRQTIEWSYDLLEFDERRLFARLAVFSGGWTLEAAEAVCEPGLGAPILDGLSSLMDNSLVQPADVWGHESRFSMLETVKEYATQELAALDGEEELRRRHAEYFRNLAEEAEPPFISDIQAAWEPKLEREHDNIRAALAWAIQSGEARTGLRIAKAVWRLLLPRWHLAEGRATLERLLGLPEAQIRDGVRAGALVALGGIVYWLNDYEAARTAFEEAVEIGREVGDDLLLAQALMALEPLARIDRDFERAEALLREGLVSAQRLNARALPAIFRARIAFLEVFRGEPAAALEPLHEAVAILRQAGARWFVAGPLLALGSTELLLGDLVTAAGHLREALEIFVEAGNAVLMGSAIRGLAQVASAEGRHQRAARLLGVEARIREEVGGGFPPEIEARFGDTEGDARRALGDQTYERVRAEGIAMDTERAVSYALAQAESEALNS